MTSFRSRTARSARRLLVRWAPIVDRRRRLAYVVLAVGSLGGLGAATAAAQTASASALLQTNLPAGPLAAALERFAAEAGVSLNLGAVDAARLRDLRSPGLQGRHTVDDGFSQLLAGSGLAVEKTASGYALKEADADADVQRVVVTGTSETRELPRVFAGGQVARGGRVGLLGDLDYMDTPFSTTAYTAKTVQDSQARTIADVLHDDPSIQPQFPRSSFSDQIQIRGFGQGADAYFVNGLFGIAPTLTTVGELAERIELIKGPSAMLNGLAPVGGTVDLRTKRAGDAPLTQATLDYGSDAQFGGHLDLGRRFGDANEWGVRFNGVYRDGDTASDHQSQRLGLAAIGIDRRGDRFRFSLDLIDQHQRLDSALSQIYYDAPGPLPKAPDAETNIQQKWEYETSSARIAVSRAEFDVTNDWQLYAAAGGLRGKEEQLRGIGYTWSPDGSFHDSPFYYRGYTHNESAQVGVKGRFEIGETRHALTLDFSGTWRSLGYAQNYGANLYPEYASNLYDPVDAPRPYVFPLSSLAQNERTILGGVALADVVSMFDDRFTLIAGARIQRVRTKSYDVDEYLSPTFGDLTADYDEQATTPSVGFIVRPWKSVSFYASVIQGLEPGPSAPSDPTYVNSGEVFPPNKTKQAEGGVKLDLGDFGATLAAFRIAQPSGRTVLLDGGLKRFEVNGEQVNRGLELSMFGEPVPGLRPLGGVAYTEAKLTKTEDDALDGRTAAGVPRFAANLGLEWDVPGLGGVTLTGRAVYKTKQYYFDYVNTIPSWTRFDVGARYAFMADDRPVTLRVAIENVANRGYWESAANGLLLGSPRTVLMSATLDF